MTYISRKEVETLGRKPCGKEDIGVNDERLLEYFQLSMDHFKRYCEKSSSYELSQITNHVDHWLKDNRTSPVYETYGVGSILYVDFGAMNFGYELSFPHPCVVLAEEGVFLLVAPCSTKKYGHDFPDILDGRKEDGFHSDTGLVLDNIRWISKGRVIAKMGWVKEDFLRELTRRCISYFPKIS